MNDPAPACMDADPAMFFSTKPATVAAAQDICRRCPIREQCLENQLTFERSFGRHARSGIYGGMTPDDRYEVDVLRWGDPRRVPAKSPTYTAA